jgi:hypothetical protein
MFYIDLSVEIRGGMSQFVEQSLKDDEPTIADHSVPLLDPHPLM